MTVSRESASRWINPDLLARTKASRFELCEVDPQQLLSGQRLDIALKISFLEHHAIAPAFALDIYKQDIRAQTRGTFREPYDDTKKCFEDYVDSFLALDRAMHEGTYSAISSPVPLSRDLVPLNGAHRIAAACHNGIRLWALLTDLPSPAVTANSLRQLGVTENALDRCVIDYMSFRNESRLAVLWPNSAHLHDLMTEQIGDVVSFIDLDLDRNGLANLVADTYQPDITQGRKSKSLVFPGIDVKVSECFSEGQKTRILLTTPKDPELLVEKKLSIRSSTGLGFSSVHISDEFLDSYRLVTLLFSAAGRHFIKFARRKPDLIDITLKNVITAAQQFQCQGNYAVDGSSILSLYGIRRANDCDLICEHEPVSPEGTLRLAHHSSPAPILLRDPDLSFEWRGFRFISLDEVAQSKHERDEVKDRLDLAAIEAIRTPTLNESWFSRTKRRTYWIYVFSYRVLRERVRKSRLDLFVVRLAAWVRRSKGRA